MNIENGNPNPQYRIVEIFESLQGEGYNTGMPSIFIRFGKCNLACAWCDTDYQHFQSMYLSDILLKIANFHAKNIIITGGEPTIQPQLDILLEALKHRGYYLAIESNGLKPISALIDYVVISPKPAYQQLYFKKTPFKANEVRIVVDGKVTAFCQQIEQLINAQHYFLSPCEISGQMNVLETIRQLGELNARKTEPHWGLSIQSHKLANIE